MKNKYKIVKVVMSEGEYNFLKEFSEAIKKSNPKHQNDVTLSSLIRFVVQHFYMSYLLGKVGDLKEVEDEFMKKVLDKKQFK
jgi:hypothetical protein